MEVVWPIKGILVFFEGKIELDQRSSKLASASQPKFNFKRQPMNNEDKMSFITHTLVSATCLAHQSSFTLYVPKIFNPCSGVKFLPLIYLTFIGARFSTSSCRFWRYERSILLCRFGDAICTDETSRQSLSKENSHCQKGMYHFQQILSYKKFLLSFRSFDHKKHPKHYNFYELNQSHQNIFSSSIK